ncbi:MAG: hypothetical protein H0U10_10445 [Chloroflexia bacterium]|nr:hypothetical protein [Chloroflexia bacterium]
MGAAVREIVTITDLTRMSGNQVCLAGCLPDGRCIRPLFRFGHPEEPWLYQGARAAIRPFAAVELRLIEQPRNLAPPHIEDWHVDRAYRHRYDLDPIDRHELLRDSAAPSLDGAFGAVIGGERGSWGRWVAAGAGVRSLTTVRARSVHEIAFGPSSRGKREYRLGFADETGAPFRLMATDLAFRCRLDALVDREGCSFAEASRALLRRLMAAEVFLRVGLARGWARHPERCYLQVNGIYSFPDYLGGRCFADFIDDPGRDVPF